MLLASRLDVLRVSLQGMSAKAYKNICGIDLDYARLLEHLRYFYDKRGNCRLYVKVVDEALEAVEETLFYDTFSNISDRMFIEKIKPVYDGVTYNERPDNVTIDRYGNIHAPRLVCPLPFFMITVWPDGSVAPCETIYKPVTLGNVNAQNLLDLWRGEKLRRFWEEQLSNGKSSFPRCQKCCAPDDVSHPLDVLDDARDALLKKIGSIESMYIA
jgi:radical SAM protein with 4Fe4S-binding SPASM domain